ncbi:MAG: hypothetical protein SGI83_15040 [Bacteroidota bacterium]|nr:hypothetical protein [Bacteroidota bacterium]
MSSRKILLLPIFFLAAVTTIKAQNGVAVSSNPGPGLHVALNWEPHSTGVKYNIFRKKNTDASYPLTPLNASPVVILSNCPAIRTLLITSPDSANWKIVARSLSDVVLFNPCAISTLARTSEKYKRLKILAKSSMPIAIAAGLGYKDNTVVNGTTYMYRIVALNASNTALGNVATDLTVTAGTFVLLPPPASVVADPGDATILVRWNDVAGAAGYIIERAPAAAGVYQRVNESDFSAEVKNKLNGDTLVPSWNGLLDFKRYKIITGNDSTHLVKGIAISGPDNGSPYYYRISTTDLFKRAGAVSAITGPVSPADSTRPSVPTDLLATPDDITGKITLRWTQVTKDMNGHVEKPDSTILTKIYRFTSSDNPDNIPSVYLGQAITIRGLKSRDTIDADPNLRGIYGNKTWWYRMKAVDLNGNTSQWSTAVSAIIKDITPPSIAKGVETKGFEDYISVKWIKNPEPDIASYMVYRSLCHLGDWVACTPKQECKEWANYDADKLPDDKDPTKSPNEREAAGTAPKGPRLPCPCSGSFVFLGEITKDSVQRAINAGNFFFNDRTIPAGSPLCYAYWIKAKDSSDNMSGSFPIPSAAERPQIKCERLRDRTPPEAALISGLFAQAEQIKVEWIGPPTQDTRAYHVYRAEGTNPAVEPGPTAYNWVGGMTVELPPTIPQVLAIPYTATGIATCDKISVQATPWMSQGYFEDKTIKAKLTYWYKVVGIDYDGNETPNDKAAAISTFSFSRQIAPAPVVQVDKQPEPCAAVIKWTPVYDPSLHIGFIVYRANNVGGPYLPVVVSPVKGNSYMDTNVIKGQTYWYNVGALMSNGRLSTLSAGQSVTL